MKYDLTGQRFGKLIAIEPRGKDSQRNQLWLCKCDCGNEKITSSHRLRYGRTPDCGCSRVADDLKGQRFGRLTVIERVKDIRGKNGRAVVYLRCKCDCGNIKVVYKGALTGGHTVSCGCQTVDNNKSRAMVHSQREQKIYYVYQAMKARCNRPSEKTYKFYGARGIKVCDEWNSKHGFPIFKEWAFENGYKDGLTIERIDVNGNYEPSNCRWATYVEQAHNTRRNVFAEYKGETKILQEWAEELGIKPRLLSYHHKRGKTIEEIVLFYEKKRAKSEISNNKAS